MQSHTTRNLIIFASGAFVGGGAAYLYQRKNRASPSIVSIPQGKSTSVSSPPPATALTPFTHVQTPNPRHFELLKYGLPMPVQLQLKQNFVSIIDYEKRIPRFVIEHLNRETLKGRDGVDRSKVNFKEDDDVPAIYRAKNSDYFKSGYSRGHMAPASNSKSSMEAMQESFLFNSNIVPQDLDNNMYYWHRMELWAKDLASKKGFDDVYVMSGPLFLPSPLLPVNTDNSVVIDVEAVSVTTHEADGTTTQTPPKLRRSYSTSSLPSQLTSPNSPPDVFTPPPSVPTSSKSAMIPAKPFKQVNYKLIGDSNVAVPTHIFKAILAEKKASKQGSPPELYFAAFIVPNTPIAEFLPLPSFRVSKETLEKYAGFQIFDKAFERYPIMDLCSLNDPERKRSKESICSLTTPKQHRLFQLNRDLGNVKNLNDLEKVYVQIKELERSGDVEPDRFTEKTYERMKQKLSR